MMWLLRQPTAEAMASFVVEFCAATRHARIRGGLSAVRQTQAAQGDSRGDRRRSGADVDARHAGQAVLRADRRAHDHPAQMVAEGTIKIPVKRPAAKEHLHPAGGLDVTLPLRTRSPPKPAAPRWKASTLKSRGPAS